MVFQSLSTLFDERKKTTRTISHNLDVVCDDLKSWLRLNGKIISDADLRIFHLGGLPQCTTLPDNSQVVDFPCFKGASRPPLESIIRVGFRCAVHICSGKRVILFCPPLRLERSFLVALLSYYFVQYDTEPKHASIESAFLDVWQAFGYRDNPRYLSRSIENVVSLLVRSILNVTLHESVPTFSHIVIGSVTLTGLPLVAEHRGPVPDHREVVTDATRLPFVPIIRIHETVFGETPRLLLDSRRNAFIKCEFFVVQTEEEYIFVPPPSTIHIEFSEPVRPRSHASLILQLNLAEQRSQDMKLPPGWRLELDVGIPPVGDLNISDLDGPVPTTKVKATLRLNHSTAGSRVRDLTELLDEFVSAEDKAAIRSPFCTDPQRFYQNEDRESTDKLVNEVDRRLQEAKQSTAALLAKWRHLNA